MRIHITKSFALAGLLALTTSAGLAQVMSSTNPNPACASLQLWLRADQGVAADGAGSVVTAWTNQATSAAAVGNATAAIIGAGSGPTLDGGSAVLNGQPALAFDGASEGLDLTNNAADLLAGGLYTVFIVLYDAGPNTTWHQFQMLMGNNYNTVYLYAIDPWAGSQYNDQFDIQSGSPSWSSVDSSGCITNDDPYLLTAVAAGTSAGATRLYVDGTENDSGAAMPAFNLNSDWYIGYDPGNSSRWFAGEIAEILIYQGALANTDIGAIDAYLGNKYNISVPLPVASSPTFYPQAGTYFGAQSRIDDLLHHQWHHAHPNVTQRSQPLGGGSADRHDEFYHHGLCCGNGLQQQRSVQRDLHDRNGNREWNPSHVEFQSQSGLHQPTTLAPR